MRPVALASVLAVFAGPICAEEISVRSGDHPTFTRLVLSIPAESAWSLSRVPDGYQLDVDGATDYDAAAVFGRISRDRIADLVAVEDRLRIVVECECHADAFLFRPDRLVVDIVEGPAPPDSEFERLAEAAEPPEPVTPRVDPRMPGAALPLLPDRLLQAGMPSTVSPEPVVVPETIVDPGLTAAVDAAATAGLLTRAEDAPPPLDALDAAPNVSVPGLSSLSGLQSDALQNLAAANTPCPDPALYDVSSWEDPGVPFLEEFADLRRTSGTDGQATPEERLALARFLVAHGMGREALGLLDAETPETQALRRMALRLDEATDIPDSQPGWRACAAPVILWESAIGRDLDGLRSDQVDGLLSAFLVLPPAVAGRIGTELALDLAETRHTEAADTILGRLSASPWVDDLALARIDSRIDRLGGTPDRAVQRLTELNESDGLDAIGFVDLLELQLEIGAEIEPELLAQGEILRRENRRSPAGGHLARVLSLAHSARGDHAEALALLETARDDLARVSPDLPAILHQDLMLAVSETGSDELFLEIAFGTDPDVLDPLVRRSFSNRLEAMGFGETPAGEPPTPTAGTPPDIGLTVADAGSPDLPGPADALPVDAATLTIAPEPVLQEVAGGPADAGDNAPLQVTPLRERQLVLEQSGAARLRLQDLLDGTPSPATLGTDG